MDLPMHSPPDSTGVTPVAPVAVTNERWRLRGAHDDALRIPTDGWSYPYTSGITILSRGEIHKDIRAHDFPPAFEQDLLLLPVVNWQLLPDGRDESVFWHGSTPSNTLIATWWNAALGRDATNPVCFQAELYTNGGFDYRYEDRTVRHVRVWPFDLDDDGLENSVDPDPLVAGPDAHGTNAEWYNTVCSNVLEAVAATSAALPPELTWREGVNSNAYYFVDVVASNGPAPIYFTGDRESRIGWIGFSCCGSGNCGCCGCAIAGEAVLEDTTFYLPDVWCGCWHNNPFYPGIGPSLTNMPPVFASFDKAVVFYEDAYTNAPNDVVAKHSTNTTLTVFAYGGEAGRMLYVSEHNIGKLVRTGGKAITFPYAAFVPPNSGMSFSIEYEAETHSDSEGDITVTASITPGDGGGNISTATTTVVKVLLETQIPSVFNANRSRHQYGVREIVMCQHEPSSINVTWETTNGQVAKQNGALWHFQAPLFAMDCGLSIRTGVNDSYFPSVSIVEPTGFSCARATIIESQLGTNVAGGAGMSLELYIMPTNVCFGNIAMEEVPTDTGFVGGHFENEEFCPYWAHTRDRRAGDWKNIGNDNLFLIEDEAIMDEALPPMAPDGTLTNDVSFGWRDGAIIWTIPLGWNEHGTSGEMDPAKTNAVPEHQTFVITPDGTLTVAKAGYCASRGTNTQTRRWEIAR